MDKIVLEGVGYLCVDFGNAIEFFSSSEAVYIKDAEEIRKLHDALGEWLEERDGLVECGNCGHVDYKPEQEAANGVE